MGYIEILTGALGVVGGLKGSAVASDSVVSAEIKAAKSQTEAAEASLTTWKWVFVGSLVALFVLIALVVIIKRK